MRLIDADELKKQEVLEKLRTAEFDDEIEDVIETIPTAYDVDKVVEKLKRNSMPFMGDKDDRDVDLNGAIKIVKSGGIE
ncbi:MAG: hypothetical protein K1W20_04935 [Lachnospiraceae bacterium]